MSLVFLFALHSLGRFVNNDSTLVHGSCKVEFSFLQGPSSRPRGRPAMVQVEIQVDAPLLDISVAIVQAPFDSDQKIKVPVDRRRSSELATLEICSRVSFARALRPQLVALGATQRAGAERTAWTAIFRTVCIAAAALEARAPARVSTGFPLGICDMTGTSRTCMLQQHRDVALDGTVSIPYAT